MCFSHSCVHLEIFYKKENDIKMILKKIGKIGVFVTN